jgi:hypothetical protein
MKRLIDWRESSIYRVVKGGNTGAKIMRLRGICKKMGEKVGGSMKNDYLCGGF